MDNTETLEAAQKEQGWGGVPSPALLPSQVMLLQQLPEEMDVCDSAQCRKDQSIWVEVRKGGDSCLGLRDRSQGCAALLGSFQLYRDCHLLHTHTSPPNMGEPQEGFFDSLLGRLVKLT